MSLEIARQLIMQTHEDEWDPDVLRVVHENQETPDITTAWGRLVILNGDSIPMALGDASVRHFGVLVLQVFTPEGQGTRPANLAGDAFSAIWNRRQLRDGQTYLNFETMGVVDAGNRQGYLQKNFTVQFRHDRLL